jgi:2-isopropylmalate synthase
MPPADKLRIALALEAAGVDLIEIGFPASSEEDFRASRAIASRLTRSVPAVLARAVPGDIERAAAALEGVGRRRIHVFSPVSDIHIEHKLGSNRAAVLASVPRAVALARAAVGEVQFGCEDATRADRVFLAEMIEAAIEAGAATVTVADTTGYAIPAEFAGLIADLVNRFGEKGVCFAVHCHDDLGQAVANSLAGLRAGARQVECTLNGIGERAGNAALEEVVVALSVRRDWFGLATGVDATHFWGLSRLVSEVIGMELWRHKAIVGDNIFAHESGIHQHGVIACPHTYEIMKPGEVGAPQSRIVLGKHSGRHGLEARLAELGLSASGDMLARLLQRCKAEGAREDIADNRLRTLYLEVAGA